MNSILKNAGINAFGTALYVIVIVTFISSLENLFGNEGENLIFPITMLMLFVFSAALTGFLVFGKPLIWFIEGKKKQALALLFSTLTILFMLIIIVFIVLINLWN